MAGRGAARLGRAWRGWARQGKDQGESPGDGLAPFLIAQPSVRWRPAPHVSLISIRSCCLPSGV